MWVNIHYDVCGDLIYQCSECKKLTNEDFPYCPYCGHKHKKDKE